MNAKAIGRAFARGALRSLIFIVRILPLSVGLWIGRGIGLVLRPFFRRRFKVALENLDLAYGDTLTRAEKERIARQSFINFGMFAIESIKFALLPLDEVKRRIHVRPGALEAFDEMMKAHRNGCLLITAHLGHAEIPARLITEHGHELIALARPARDQGTTDIVEGLRNRMGIKTFQVTGSLKPVIASLKRNALVGIVCDQNSSDVYVPFFGRMTGTVDGPAKISLRFGAPMVLFYCVRDGKGGYILDSEGEPLWPEPTGDEEADVARLATEINRRLESVIRKYPEQWLWFHDRWRATRRHYGGEVPLADEQLCHTATVAQVRANMKKRESKTPA